MVARTVAFMGFSSAVSLRCQAAPHWRFHGTRTDCPTRERQSRGSAVAFHGIGDSLGRLTEVMHCGGAPEGARSIG